MVIVADFRCSVQDYVAQFARLVFPRPAACPCCGQAGSLVGHGFYVRQALDQQHVFRVRIKRWRCKACRRSTSVLPSFLLRFRHYLLAVISQTLVARFELGASWLDVLRCVAVDGLPSPRTIGRWCRSFAAHAALWWAAVGVLLHMAQMRSYCQFTVIYKKGFRVSPLSLNCFDESEEGKKLPSNTKIVRAR